MNRPMLKPLTLTSLLAAALLSAAAFGQATTPPPATDTKPTTPVADLPDAPGTVPTHPTIEPTGPTVVFDTTMGRLTCKLFDKQAPNTVASFIGLATGTKPWTDPNDGKRVTGKNFYNGTTFHRVIPNFMIQGGDRKGDGTGDAGFYLDDEIVPGLTFDVPGRLAMANSGPNTNGTQFFITEAPQPELDGKYTIFGQCDTHTVLMVASIARVDRNASDKPLTPVTINQLTIVKPGDPIPPVPAAPATSAPPAAPPQN